MPEAPADPGVRGKTLVVCCDGTWNTADQKGAPTNVTKLTRAILKRSPEGRPQIVYYDEGVGTGNRWDRWWGGALGLGLNKNVQRAYRFLALNYEEGDCIALFGFSRGAFTVRSLAGLVGSVGLLRKGDLDRMPDIWTYYRTPPAQRGMIDPDWIACRPDIDLLGVWDTVGSLGIPGNLFRWVGRRHYAFHDVTLSKRVKRAYHALAVDEFRKSFVPAAWDTSKGLADGQVVEQRWFAGCHSNIGGGYPNASLSDRTFRWMHDRIKDMIALDDDYFRRRVELLGAGEARGLLVDSRSGIWKLLPKTVRTVGGDASECIDESVYWRMASKEEKMFASFPYAPANVKAPAQPKPARRSRASASGNGAQGRN